MDWFISGASLLASVVIVFVALGIAYLVCIKEELLQRWAPCLIALAIGVLLGDAFMHLLPEALAISETQGAVLLWTLGGILLFYAIEQYLCWHHSHDIQIPPHSNETSKPTSYARMNLIGDGIHNFVDGILIAGSFLADPMLGVATTVAIVIHEIPQELSDIAVLVHGGYTRRKAIYINTLCACSCIAGVIVTLMAAHLMTLSLSALLAITAGGFIYIATTDLIPLLRQAGINSPKMEQMLATATGILAMQLIVWIEHANHIEH